MQEKNDKNLPKSERNIYAPQGAAGCHFEPRTCHPWQHLDQSPCTIQMRTRRASVVVCGSAIPACELTCSLRDRSITQNHSCTGRSRKAIPARSTDRAKPFLHDDRSIAQTGWLRDRSMAARTVDLLIAQRDRSIAQIAHNMFNVHTYMFLTCVQQPAASKRATCCAHGGYKLTHRR